MVSVLMCAIMYLSIGGALGGAFGLFMAGLDSPITHEKMTTRETLRDMGQRSRSYAKNFAIVGFMFAGSECLLETVRQTNQYYSKLVFQYVYM